MDTDLPTPDDGADVEALLRLAGPAAAVPGERAERVRAAVRGEWRRAVNRRSYRRAVLAGLAAATILAAVLGWWPARPPTPPPGASVEVESLYGEAFCREPGGTSRPLSAGDRIARAAEVWTAAGSRVSVRLASGHSLRLDAVSRLKLLGGCLVGLERGALYVDSGTGGAAIEVKTRFGDIREIGTQFEVRLGDRQLLVRLREGAVVFRGAGGEHEVSRGSELRIDDRGAVTRRALPAQGPEWQWVAGIAPLLDLEGRTARAFLEWVARERGLRLAFRSPEVERAAGETVLRGSPRRLTLDQALDAVLPSCRMTYRIEGETLAIAAGE